MTVTRIIEIFGEPIQWGGQESYVINQVKNMNLSGLHIDLLTPYQLNNPYYEKVVQGFGGKIYHLDIPFSPGTVRTNLMKPLRCFLLNHSYDVAHIHSGSTSVLAIASKVAKLSGIKKVITHSHSAVDHLSIIKRINRFACGQIMWKYVDNYCACSKLAANAKYIKKAQEITKILPNGIDTQRFSFSKSWRIETRNAAKVNDETLVLGNVGRLSFEKNQAYLIRILSELRQDDIDAVLWLVGEGKERKNLEHLVSAYALEDRVMFWGSSPEPEKYLSGMDVYLFPSLWEGLPIALLEAQCSGLPCIYSDRISNEGIIGCNTVIAKSVDADPRTWAAEIEKIPLKRNELGKEYLIKLGFDANASAQSLREIYTA